MSEGMVVCVPALSFEQAGGVGRAVQGYVAMMLGTEVVAVLPPRGDLFWSDLVQEVVRLARDPAAVAVVVEGDGE